MNDSINNKVTNIVCRLQKTLIINRNLHAHTNENQKTKVVFIYEKNQKCFHHF